MTSQRESLRRLSLHDQGYLDALRTSASNADSARLDPRSCSLGRMAALYALDGPEPSYGWAASIALASGVTSDEMVALLIAIAPVIGSARVVAAAPKLGLALGYDVEADIEGREAGPDAADALG
jgi:4-carboxymuconolactone decarboxylase